MPTFDAGGEKTVRIQPTDKEVVCQTPMLGGDALLVSHLGFFLFQLHWSTNLVCNFRNLLQ
jgi:hypothetical protein